MTKANAITVGDRFGKLVVISILQRKYRAQASLVECRCDCGTIKIRSPRHLFHDKIKSCGCSWRENKKKIHGHTIGGKKSKTYRTWRSMMQRCYRVKERKYAIYGGRGISVCERWHTFSNFLLDMGEVPPKLTLDRINCNGNYEPSNCRWATINQQARNKRTTTIVEYAGVKKPVSDWADEIGIKATTLRNRLRRGWSAEKALTTPVMNIYEISALGIQKKYPKPR